MVLLKTKLLTQNGFTQTISAAVSAELKAMLHNGAHPHHESGPKHVAHDNELIIKMMATVEMKPLYSNLHDPCKYHHRSVCRRLCENTANNYEGIGNTSFVKQQACVSPS